jgi:hypothetical protein
MKLQGFGVTATFEWFQQILSWSRNKISFQDNMDGKFITANVGTSETQVGHTLGRVPQYIFEVAAFPNGTAGITYTRASTIDKIYIKRNVAGSCTLFLT